MRIVSWFSCGVTSAVATKLALEKYPDLIAVYCDTGSEHPDNVRFISDCEEWFGKKIQILQSEKFKSIWEVFDKGYLVGPKGAACTNELKKKVRKKFQQEDDLQIFGFDIKERARASRFKENNPDTETFFPLIEASLSKQDCLAIIQKEKIELPQMYKLGFRNNNCIGCVKGGAGYWNKIREMFPDVFDRMSRMERKLNISILSDRTGGNRKRLFLDELKPGTGRYQEIDVVCGLFCGEL